MTTMISPQTRANLWLDNVRLVWALALKDIVDAIKNKTTLTTIVISILMVAFYRYFPALISDGDTLRVMVYAEADSTLLAALERSPALAVRTYESQERVLNLLSDSESPELGITIPASAEAALQAGEPVVLDGFTMRWLSDQQRSEIKTLVEEELAISLGQPVTVQLTGNEVDLYADGDFFHFSATIALIFIATMIGISLIPNLMIEEKQAKTLEVLMISPARPAHIVAGKAVAGMFYGLLGCAVVMIAFKHLVVQWELAILAAVLGTLFLSAIGLLLGGMVEGRAQLQLIAWFVILPLVMPVVLVFLTGLIPDAAIAVMQWFPTVIIARLFRLSFTIDVILADYAIPLAVTLAFTLALLALVTWQVRRQDRV